MPRPKKADKQKKEEVVLDLRQDREEFLKAFEKPTQIYRFLRARHHISPVFLHRSLLYMLDRCSRNSSRRKLFQVNDLLSKSIAAQQSNIKQPHLNQLEQLKIVVAGFYIDPGVSQENSIGRKFSEVDAEVCLRKTYRGRRKDGYILQEEHELGIVEVSVNPRNLETSASESICLNTSNLFQSSEGQTVKNFSLIFRVYEPSDDFSDDSSEMSDSAQSDDEMNKNVANGEGRKRKLKDDPAGISIKNLKSGSRRRQNSNNEDCKSDDESNSNAEPLHKAKRSSVRSQEALYEAELDIFTSDRQTVLVDGEYDLSLTRKHTRASDGRKNATWEALDGGREIKVLSTMTSAPVLKFNLTWSISDKPGPLADVNSSENKASTDEPEAKRLRRKSSARAEDEIANQDNKKSEEVSVYPVDSVNYRKQPKLVHTSKHLNGGDLNGFSENGNVVYYQFIYNNESQQQTEARNDLYCPWCQLNCMTLYGLIKHLKLTHPRFHFTYTSHDQGCCIEVSVNECYDGSFCGNPQIIYSQPGMAFSRRGPIRRVPVTDTLYFRTDKDRRLARLSPSELLEKEENEAPPAAHYAAGHHRLYFHSDTNIPIRPCEFDVDSEEEPDPDWLKDHIRKMLDEFTDVNDGEKPIMKLWNLYIMKHSCIADCQMGETCLEFLDLHGGTIHRLNLRRNLLLHLITLVDFGVLKTSVLLSLMQHFDKIAEKERNGTRKYSRLSPINGSSSNKDKTTRDRNNSTYSDVHFSERSAHLQSLQEIIDAAQTETSV